MTRPLKKQPQTSPPAQHRHPHLRLLERATLDARSRAKRRHHRRVVLGFTLITLITFGGLAYLAFYSPADLSVATRGFASLHEVYEREGIQRFRQEKEALRSEISKTLQTGGDPEMVNAATNIAVYLFPEVLPEENMEKDVGQEMWVPLQERIESAPRTPESRRAFEEMRANIWNYENPNKLSPELSQQAKQVIRIYEGLSAH